MGGRCQGSAAAVVSTYHEVADSEPSVSYAILPRQIKSGVALRSEPFEELLWPRRVTSSNNHKDASSKSILQLYISKVIE